MGSILGKIIPGFEIPNSVLIFAAVSIIAGLIITKTIVGRYGCAIGSNEEATRLSGVNVDAWKIAIYSIWSFSGFTNSDGFRLNSAQPALGAGMKQKPLRQPLLAEHQ